MNVEDNSFDNDRTSYDIHKIENPFKNTEAGKINFSEDCDSTYVVDMQELYNSLENIDVDSDFMEKLTVSLAKEAKEVGIKFELPSIGGNAKKSDEFVTMGFYTPSDDNLHIAAINQEYTLAHELIHKLNNKVFPSKLGDVLSPENRLIS